jgi:serine phosphatase RsbU (regulator of sigma subunit)
MRDEVFETVRAFAGENPPSDDATLVVFTRNGLSA